jgi:hypothetical protein
MALAELQTTSTLAPRDQRGARIGSEDRGREGERPPQANHGSLPLSLEDPAACRLAVTATGARGPTRIDNRIRSPSIVPVKITSMVS